MHLLLQLAGKVGQFDAHCVGDTDRILGGVFHCRRLASGMYGINGLGGTNYRCMYKCMHGMG